MNHFSNNIISTQKRKAASEKEQKMKIMGTFENVHLKIILFTFCLCTLGVVMVYSSSYYNCSSSKICNYDAMFFAKKQLKYMFLGFLIILLGTKINFIEWTRLLNYICYFVSICMIFLLFSPLGVSSHGARRWIRFGGIQFQVAELVKITVILTLAFIAHKYQKYAKRIPFTFTLWAVGFVPAILIIVLSSDLSSGIVIAVITFGISFVVTKTLKLHLATAGVVISVGIMYVLKIAYNLPSPEELERLSYRVSRIAAWISPETYAQGQGYQILNGIYAIGSGGGFGKGIGNSMMSHGFIPEAHNDMIYAIICEELGGAGGILLIIALVYLTYLIMRVAVNADRLYESVICIGIAIHLGFQSIINIAVALNVFPNTGVPLPFISYGGTTVLCNLLEIALVVNISKKHDLKRAAKEYRRMKG